MDKAQKNYKKVLKVLEADTKTIKDNNLVIEIKTLLNIVFIAL